MVTSGLPFPFLGWAMLAASWQAAQPFSLPTANYALFTPGAEDQFFAPTPTRTWQSGSFGCVRTEGWQFHEGIDIRCLERDRRGEPTDPVLATAEGKVVYINRVAGNSNYGQYLVLEHRIEGMPLYSLYSHLRQIPASLKPGRRVRAREPVGIMGRTGQPISKDRAHVHFEISLLLNDQFETWHRLRFPKTRNDHGNWNGRTLIGIDPAALLLRQQAEGAEFQLLTFLRQQTELCRVWIAQTNFFWLHAYPGLVRPNPVAAREGTAGYEVALNFIGMPFELIPRAQSELGFATPFQLLSVNPEEWNQRPCGKIVSWDGRRWALTERAQELLDLLTFP